MRGSVPSVVEGSGSGWIIRLCGPMEVRAGDRALGGALPGRQGRLLLAYLTVNRDRACPRTELIDVLWPEAPPAAADAALSALLSKLRRTLGDGRADRALGGPADACGRGLGRRRAGSRGRAAGPRRRCTTATGARPRAAAREALAAGDRGAFLPDCDGPWLHEQRGALDGLRVRALEVLAEASLRAGAPAEAADAARAAVTAAPFRESAHVLLMEAHAAAGNPAEALRAFDDLRRLLREELGTAPGPAAMALHERVLHGRAPAGRGAAPAAPRRDRRAPLARAARRGARAPRRSSAARPRRRGCRTPGGARGGGARGLVVIAGEAGIGKTRLAAELAGTRTPTAPRCCTAASRRRRPRPTSRVVAMLRGWAGGASLAPLAERLGPRAAELGLAAARARHAGRGPGRPAARGRVRRQAAAAVRRDGRAAGRDRRRRAAAASCSTTSTGRTCRRSS